MHVFCQSLSSVWWCLWMFMMFYVLLLVFEVFLSRKRITSHNSTEQFSKHLCCSIFTLSPSLFRWRFALCRLEHLWRRGTAMGNSPRTCVWMRQRSQHFHLIRIICSLHRDLRGISTLDLMQKMPRPTKKGWMCLAPRCVLKVGMHWRAYDSHLYAFI